MSKPEDTNKNLFLSTPSQMQDLPSQKSDIPGARTRIKRRGNASSSAEQASLIQAVEQQLNLDTNYSLPVSKRSHTIFRSMFLDTPEE
jgi:hypothetical protein